MAFIRILRILLLAIFAFLSLIGLLFSTWFLLYSVTGTGRILAIIGIALALLPLSIYLGICPSQDSQRWRWISFFLGMLAISGFVVMMISAPDGRSAPNSPVIQYMKSTRQFPRFSLPNLIPEAEQVNLGFWVMPYLDPLLTKEQAEQVSAFTLDIYGEMDRDPHFHRLGSAMCWAYAELLGRPFDVGHYSLYLPHHRPDHSLPVILFLHGSAGNFKAYTWIWSHLAEDLGYAIIAPSFGFGNWQQEEGVTAALDALEAAQGLANLDSSRIYLAGLSNGGIGVSLLAKAQPDLFKGLIFISPVMVPKILDHLPFHHVWANRPILVITGEADKRIPVAYVEQRVAALESGDVAVTYFRFPAEDHFLFFTQQDAVLAQIAQWLQDNEG